MASQTKVRLTPSWRLLGPAFVAAIAYVDPGNVAANISAGSQYGFLLVWVIVAANAMAGLVQYLSAKLGLVTGNSLPEVIGAHSTRSMRIAYWLQAELVAIATDLAEVVGGAIALSLIFGLPVLLGGLITGVVSMGLLALGDRRGPRAFEQVTSGLLIIIAVGFVAGLVVDPPEAAEVAAGLIPRFDDTESVLLATAILGATVMPHAVYLHSGLARDRHGQPPPGSGRRRLLRVTRWDVGLAMLVAGALNLAMLVLAATDLRGLDHSGSIEGAHAAIGNTLGPGIALLFAVGLLASGLASTSVGAYAGAMIMQGLVRISVPVVGRRLLTLCPALAILAWGVEPTRALVISQVVLSFGIPLALVPLIRATGDRSVMGEDANGVLVSTLGWTVTAVIATLNVALIYLTLR